MKPAFPTHHTPLCNPRSGRSSSGGDQSCQPRFGSTQLQSAIGEGYYASIDSDL